MFQFIQSQTLHQKKKKKKIPNQTGLLGNWILSTRATQQDLTICVASHTVFDPLTMKPIHLLTYKQAHTPP